MNKEKDNLRKVALKIWSERLKNADFVLRTVSAIMPVFDAWLTRRHVFLSFRLVQVFQAIAACYHCSSNDDSSEHTLEACPAWSVERNALDGRMEGDARFL
ncbi:unnamed protein product [Leptosia nina]|uniref:Reverse transcriptase n=1 Tax=Leptosia nina TaxID=320188 RepID=A0AAV1JVY3_9NEOP